MRYNYYLIESGSDCDGRSSNNNDTVPGYYSLTCANTAAANANYWSDGIQTWVVSRETMDRDFPELLDNVISGIVQPLCAGMRY